MPLRIAFWGLFTICLLVALLTTAAAATKPNDFVQKATIGNQFEIESSKLALQNSHDDNVKQFAQEMLDDHTQIAGNLKSVISNSSAELSEPALSLDSKHQRMLDRLRKLSGEDFDRKYVDDQTKAHDDAVSLFKDYVKNGDNAELKSFASQTLPTLRQHQEHIRQLKTT